MQIKYKLVVALFLFSNIASAGCLSDISCGLGNVCVKPEGAIGITGICVTPSDSFGNKTYEYISPSFQPREIPSCSFDLDCGLGFSCVKKNGEMNGICVK